MVFMSPDPTRSVRQTLGTDRRLFFLLLAMTLGFLSWRGAVSDTQPVQPAVLVKPATAGLLSNPPREYGGYGFCHDTAWQTAFDARFSRVNRGVQQLGSHPRVRGTLVPPFITHNSFIALADFVCLPNHCRSMSRGLQAWKRKTEAATGGFRDTVIVYLRAGRETSIFLSRDFPLFAKHHLKVVIMSGLGGEGGGGDDAEPSLQGPSKHANHARALSSPWLVAWYAQNAAFVHPKVFPLPIGFALHEAVGARAAALAASRCQPAPPTKDVLAGWSLFSSRSRVQLADFVRGWRADRVTVTVRNETKVFTSTRATNVSATYALMGDHHMVLSPRGFGADCCALGGGGRVVAGGLHRPRVFHLN